MPELPEVETYRKYIMDRASGKKLSQIEVLDKRVARPYPAAFNHFAKGCKLRDIIRVGKYLFWDLGKGHALMMHFGMTGYPLFVETGEDLPKSTRMLFRFGTERLAFVDPRKFGKIIPGESVDELLREFGPGKDALQVKEKEFIIMLEGRNTPIKAALLDQSKFSGIGNWLADEILFQSKIHPATSTHSLDQVSLKSIYREMIRVLKSALKFDADWDRFPGWFFVKQRKSKGLCPRHQVPVKKIQIAGRTTFICDRCQQAPSDQDKVS